MKMLHRIRRFANLNISACTFSSGRYMSSVRNISFGIQRPRSLLLEHICHFHETQPLFSNVVAGGFAWAVGNYISQTSSGDKFDFRMWQFAIISVVCWNACCIFVVFRPFSRRTCAHSLSVEIKFTKVR
eukprot:UN02122